MKATLAKIICRTFGHNTKEMPLGFAPHKHGNETYCLRCKTSLSHPKNPYAGHNGKMININAFNGCGGYVNGELLTMSQYCKKFVDAELTPIGNNTDNHQ